MAKHPKTPGGLLVLPDGRQVPEKDALAELANEVMRRRAARANLLDFMDYCWWMPDPFLVGYHTRAVCERITNAVDDLERGKSTFLELKICFGHGKSFIVSIALPAWIQGRLKAINPDIIQTGYGSELVEGFSRKVQAVMEQDSYKVLFPGVSVSKSKSAAANWGVEGSAGEYYAAGLGGALTGRRGHIIICDDFFKNREEAESETVRESRWESFKNDLMTRRHAATLVIVCATPWHVDDIFGRIEREMKNNPEFPRFEELCFPAESEKYPTGYLFPERYDVKWYKEQRAMLGRYNAAGLMDCDPEYRGGNMIKTDRIQYADGGDIPTGLLWVRVWDLASTEKERAKADPDYTAGALVAYKEDKDKTPTLYISDVKWIQAEAPERDKMIVKTAEDDGPGVWVGVEKVAGYKDAYTTMKGVLSGKYVVHGIECAKDKVMTVAETIEAPFEGGRVVMRKAWWNDHVVKELSQFPKGKHDDIVDAIAKGAKLAKERWKQAASDGPAVVIEQDFDMRAFV